MLHCCFFFQKCDELENFLLSAEASSASKNENNSVYKVEIMVLFYNYTKYFQSHKMRNGIGLDIYKEQYLLRKRFFNFCQNALVTGFAFLRIFPTLD